MYFKKEHALPENMIDLGSVSYTHEIAKGIELTFKLIERSGKNIKELTCIDIGVGKGWSSYILSGYLRKVSGYDLKYAVGEQMARSDECWQKTFWDHFSDKRQNLHYDFFDGYNIPEESDSADIVTAIAVLEHVGDEAPLNTMREKWLREIYRVLKPGGCFFITECPNYYSYAEALAGLLGIPRHKKRFKRNELADLLKNCGFEIKIFDYTHAFIDFYPWMPVLKLWNISYSVIFQWLEKLIGLTPLYFFFHHFRVIAVKK